MRRLWAGLVALAIACSPFGASDAEGPADPRAPLDAEARPDAQAPEASAPRVTNGLVALYTFADGKGDVVHDTIDPPLDLMIATPDAVRWRKRSIEVSADTLITSRVGAKKVFDRVMATKGLTLEAWVTPANVTQEGPARIVGMGRGSQQRNFTLGQEATELRVRLKTTGNDGFVSDEGENVELIWDAGPALATLHHVVFTRAATGARTLWVDAKEVVSATLAGDLEGWDETFALSLASENPGDAGAVKRYWRGEIHLVAIYDRALGADDVATNFAAGPSH